MISHILTSFILAGVATAQLNKPTDYSDGLSPHFVFGSYLPFNGGTYIQVNLPSQCAAYAAFTHSDGSVYCQASNMYAYNVTYPDCSLAWTVCYCNEQTESYMSVNDFLVNYGRVPVGLRQYVRYISSFPDTSASAFTELPINDIVLFADESTEAGLTVYIHENGHAIDDLEVSGSQAWINAVAADTCVPDSYADTNYVEDFAQVNVVSLWMDRVGTAPSGSSVACMSNQLAVFQNTARLTKAAMAVTTCDLGVRSQFNHLKRDVTKTRKAVWPTTGAALEEAKTASFNSAPDYGTAITDSQAELDPTVYTLTAPAHIPTARFSAKFRN